MQRVVGERILVHGRRFGLLLALIEELVLRRLIDRVLDIAEHGVDIVFAHAGHLVFERQILVGRDLVLGLEAGDLFGHLARALSFGRFLGLLILACLLRLLAGLFFFTRFRVGLEIRFDLVDHVEHLLPRGIEVLNNLCFETGRAVLDDQIACQRGENVVHQLALFTLRVRRELVGRWCDLAIGDPVVDQVIVTCTLL